MVTNVTSLTGNGLKDWLIQRVTALYLAVYSAVLFGFFAAHPQLDYSQWSVWFHAVPFKVTSILALVAFLLHAWIGIWTVTTDYITCTFLRLSVQGLVVLFLLSQAVWGFMMVWGQ